MLVDHLKRLGKVNHFPPTVDDVQRSAQDRACLNMARSFLKRFWVDGRGRVLAFEEAAKATWEVKCFFLVVSLFLLVLSLFYVKVLS